MNYKKYFILEPGKAICRQENCPKQLVYRKQGMRFHLKKYHPDIVFEQDSNVATDNGLELSLSSLIQNPDITPTYSFDPNNPVYYETSEAGPSSSTNFYGYSNDEDGFNIHHDGHDHEEHDNEDPSTSTNYDVKAELMDLLFNGSNNMNDTESNNFHDSTDVNLNVDPYTLEMETQPKINAKPKTGYLLFCAETRKRIMGENPAAGFGEISRLVGIEWSKLNGQQKLEYSTRAQQNIAQEKGANNISQSHFDERETEAPIPHKRPRNDFIQTSATVFELAHPFENISYPPPSEESLPSPSAPQYTYQNSAKKTRYQFTDADKAEIKNRIKRKEVSLAPVTGSTDIMNFVVDNSERIAVICTVCGGFLSAKGGGSITYHRNACLKLSDPARIHPHPLSAEMNKELNQKCINLMTKNYFPSVYLNNEGLLDLLQHVHNLGFNFGVESAKTAKDDISHGPAVMAEAMPRSTDIQQIIDQTLKQKSPKLKEFIHLNVKDCGGALAIESIDKYCQYLGFTFHLITKDWKFVSVPVALKEYTVPPTPDKITQDTVSLLNEFNLSLNDIKLIFDGELETNNLENCLKSASNFFLDVIQWVMNPEDGKFELTLDENTIEIMENFIKLVVTVQDVLHYAKRNSIVSVKFEDNEDDKIFFIQQFVEMPVKDYEAIATYLKDKQRLQEFRNLMDFLNPFLADIKSLDENDKPTLCMVPLLYESLMKNFNKFRNSRDKLIAAFSESAYLYLEYVKQNLICDSHYIALFLNPKLNGQIESLIQQEDLDKLLERITVECSKIFIEKMEQDEPTPKKFSNLRKRQRAETTFQTELDEYLAVEISENDQSFELLDWWKQNSTHFPRLSQIAKKYHSIPASFTSKNGVFEILNKLNPKERIATTPEMLSKMVLYPTPSSTIPSTSSIPMQPFHPGLVHNYQTLVAKCHSCLAEMNYAKISAQDAAVIDYHIAICTENLNKLLQQIATASKSSFAMVNSDAGIRTKTSLNDALDILKRYKESYVERCKEAREMSKEIPIFDGISLTWSEFWSRFKYFVGDSELPPIEKFHILSKHLNGKPKALIASLNFENDSYQEAVTLLANFSDNK
uniref:HMG box domain-containing protein n=1 Tax=Panagrolaimus sp. ES5 TaxID=591445 RepID=A0AC34FBE3_9BILA